MATPAIPKGYENENALNIVPPASAPPEPGYDEDNEQLFTPDGDRGTWQNWNSKEGAFQNEIEGKNNDRKQDEKKSIAQSQPIHPAPPKQLIEQKLPEPQSQPQSEEKLENIIKEINHYSPSVKSNISPSYTIHPLPDTKFNAASIVKNLHENYIDTGLKLKMNAKRMEQFNNIIFQTNIAQRQLIKDEYKKLYEEDLLAVIDKKFQWHQIYKQLLSLLMMNNIEFHTYCIETAVRNIKSVKLLSSLILIHDNQVWSRLDLFATNYMLFLYYSDIEGDTE